MKLFFCKACQLGKQTKHMKIKFNALRQLQQEREIKCWTSKDQLADLFTKSLAKEKFKDLREKVGSRSPAVLEPRGSVED